jgi:cyclophilin family peptidyl-prolyl cis-trans isomerase
MFPSRRAGFITLALALAALFAAVASGLGVPPVFDPIAVLDPANAADPPKVPIGKALVVPISATAEDGGAVSFKVTGSNARLPVRVKTGNPILRIHVTYAGDGAAALPFEGDLDFQLFRELAPLTAGFIAGFAQAGYYDGLTFHRVIEDFVAQGGDPAGTGSGIPEGGGAYIGLPFEFENEFQSGLIFSGRGQLAMANRGLNRGSQPLGQLDPRILLGNFKATNGSQFFVTFEQLRAPTPANPQRANLDFKHTIFGQLIRGFDLLEKIESVPTDADDDKPTVDVKMTSVKVLPAAGEATLFIGATGVGETTITVFATDSAGAVSKQTFPVRAVDDTVNDPPVMLPLTPIYANVGTRPQLQVNAFDLELDYLLYGIAAAGSGTSPGSFGNASIASTYTPRDTAGKQTLALGVAGFNDDRRFASPSIFNAFAPFDAYNFQVVELAFGDKPPRPAVETVKGVPGVALTDAIVARLSDPDASATAATLTATINWGDGTATSTGTLSRDTSAPGAASYVIRGTHTYAQAGIYTVLVTIAGDKGATAFARSTAVISADTIVAWGTYNEAAAATLSNRIVAHFTDTNPSRRVADYVATIDWGDGVNTHGVVVRAPTGAFYVRGTHAYKDSQTYAIAVRIHKKETLATADAIAWSSAFLQFKSPQYLPPFPQIHIVAAWNSGPTKAFVKPITGTFNPADLEVQFSGNFAVFNSGNRTLGSGKIRYWLSDDAVLQTTGAGADTRLKVNGFTELSLTGLTPGNGGSGNFTIALPKGQSGGGRYLLAELVYSDPIADHSAVDKVIVSGPIDPSIIIFDPVSSVTPGTMQTSEGGGTVTFKVVLDTAPTADVKIPFESSVTAEGTVAPAELTFTSANWSIPQTVVVTGVDDATDDGNKSYKVTRKTPVTTDPNYSGLPAQELNLTNVDNDP